MLINILLFIIRVSSLFIRSVWDLWQESNVPAIFSVKSGSQFCLTPTTRHKMPSSDTWSEILLRGFRPRFYPRGTTCCIRGKLLPSPASRLATRPIPMLSGPQSVSCQYAASRTYSQRTRVCVPPAYVAHVDRVVSATRFGDSPVSSCISLRDYSVCQVH